MTMLRYCCGILLLVAMGASHAASMESEIGALASAWDSANFTKEGEAKEKALAGLAERARQLSAAWPNRAEPLIWEGIVLSSWAGAKGGLGALDLVKQARDRLQRAEQLDPKALNGSVYTSLGSLYYQVPGWPLGFGDDEKAGAYLKKALSLNPDGIDPNFFYGDYLIEEGEYQQAITVLQHALEAPPRPGREVADQGRHVEIRAALEKAKEKSRPNSW